jgi:GntR family transcriptional repressor for pyruvate dehydrogenase complex
MAFPETIDIGRRETVAEAIAQGLIRYIARKGLKGGDRLPSERELTGMVGASRLPLREALCMLKGLGIVEAHQGKGVFVRPLDLASTFSMLSPLLRAQTGVDVEHLFEVRRHIEASIAELAAAARTTANLRALEATTAGMRTHGVRNRAAYIEHDMAFHQELARSTGNPVFHVFLASITDLLTEVHKMFPDKVVYREEAVHEHEAILEAVQARDPALARTAMLVHLRRAQERL